MLGHITPCQVQASSVPEQDLLPAARPAVSCIYGVEDELGEIESDQEDTAVDDPINSVIISNRSNRQKMHLQNQIMKNSTRKFITFFN